MRTLAHSSREGAVLGLLAATVIWLWIAIVDAVTGQSFRTLSLLGGPVGFTVGLYLLNVAYGVVLVRGIHGAEREPSLLIGVALLSFVVELVIVFVTILLSHVGLGELAWLRILGANVVGTLATLLFLARRHRLGEILHAEEREDEAEEPAPGRR
jgi:hypothetical protein